MQNNNRKKIIFLDGNYSEGGNDGLDGGVVTNATPPEGQSGVAGKDAGVVAGQSGVAGEDAGVNCKRVPTLENQKSNSNIVGDQESDQGSDSEEEGKRKGQIIPPVDEDKPNETRSPKYIGRSSVYIGDDESQDESQERSQGQEGVQEGGDYDYDLLSEGGRSSIDSASVVSSVATNDLLSVDPLYIRLTKFLETSNKMEGGSTANIADLLYEVSSSLKSIKVSFQEINSTLQKLAVTKASQ